MNTTHQQYIIALAETGSLTKAAARLGISQPALTRWLNSIEEELGVPLVLRSRKQLVLLPAGERYLEGALKIMEIKRKTYDAMRGTTGFKKETITISGTPNGGAKIFADIFAAFQNRYPSISLQFIEGYNSQALDLIDSGDADIGLCSTLDTDSDTFEYHITNESELILMMPSHYPLAYDAGSLEKNADFPVIGLNSLTGLPFIMPSREMSYYEGLMNLFQRTGFNPNTIFQSASTKVIYDMVKNGNGIALLPKRFFSPLDKVSPFSLKPKFKFFTAIVYKKGRELSDAEQFLIHLIVNRI